MQSGVTRVPTRRTRSHKRRSPAAACSTAQRVLLAGLAAWILYASYHYWLGLAAWRSDGGGGGGGSGRDGDAAAAAASPHGDQPGGLARTATVSIVESATWPWGACSSKLYPDSVCATSYCLKSKSTPGAHIDLTHHPFSVVSEDDPLIGLCQEPIGGQLGCSYKLAQESRGHKQRQCSRAAAARSIEVSFVISYRDAPDTTVQCLLELLRTAREVEAVEFVLIDDGSAAPAPQVDRAAAALTAHFGVLVTRLRHRRAKGYGAANNAGVRAACGRYVVLLNNDAFVTAGWLKALLETVKAERAPGIVGPLFINSTGWVQESGGVVWSDGTAGNAGRFNLPATHHMFRRSVDYISAACILMPRAVFLEVSRGGVCAVWLGPGAACQWQQLGGAPSIGPSGSHHTCTPPPKHPITHDLPLSKTKGGRLWFAVRQGLL